MKAGDLRHRVILQTVTRPTSPGATKVVADVATVWAAIEPLRGTALFQAQQAQSRVTGRIRIRYRSDVRAGMQVKFGSRYYQVEAVIPPEERKRELHLLVSEENA